MSRVAVLSAVAFIAIVVAAASSDAEYETPADPLLPVSARKNTPLIELNNSEQFNVLFRADDEVSVVLSYDSADVNSVRVLPNLESLANQIDGFSNVYAVDIRNPDMAWIMDALDVQIVPDVKIIPSDYTVRRGFEGPSFRTLHSGAKKVVSVPLDTGLHPDAIKKHVLRTFSDANVGKIELITKLKNLLGAIRNQQPFATGVPPPEEDPATLPTLFLLSFKSSASSMFKAIATNYYGRVNAIEVKVEACGGAAAVLKEFGLPVPTKPPTDAMLVLLQPVANAQPHVLESKGGIRAISTQLDKFVSFTRDGRRVRHAAEADASFRRELSRRSNPLVEVTTAEDWRADVLQRATTVGVIFAPTSLYSQLKTIAEEFQAKHPKSPVTQLMFVATGRGTKADAIRDHFMAAAGLQVPTSADDIVLVYVSGGKKLFSVHSGAVSVDSIERFVNTKLVSGIGAKSFDAVPDFS